MHFYRVTLRGCRLLSQPSLSDCHDKRFMAALTNGGSVRQVGEALATNYGAEAAAGWDFAHYVATSFRKVSDKLNLTVGKRPWCAQPSLLLWCLSARAVSAYLSGA